MKDIRITKTILRLLSVFLNNRDTDFYGLELAEAIEISYGGLLPVLMRLESAGWLESDWENIDPTKVGRPKRKYYRLTEQGITVAKREVSTEIGFLSGEVGTV